MSDEADPLVAADAYLSAGRPRDALALTGPWLAAHPDDADAAILHGRGLLEAGGDDEAREAARLADRTVALDPDSSGAWWLHVRTRDSDREALVSARRMRMLAPGETWAVQTHGAVAIEAGALAEAEASALELLAAAPDDPRSHRLLGRLRRVQVRPAESAAAYRAALAIDPDDLVAANALALIEAESDPASAVLDLSRMLGGRPRDEGLQTSLETASVMLIAPIATVTLAVAVVVLLASTLVDGLFGLALAPGARPWAGLAVQVAAIAVGAVLLVRRSRGAVRALGASLAPLVRSRLRDGSLVLFAVGFSAASAPLVVAGVVVGGTAGDPWGTVLLAMGAACALSAWAFSGLFGALAGERVPAPLRSRATIAVLVAPGAAVLIAAAAVAFLPFCIGFVAWHMHRTEVDRRAEEAAAAAAAGSPAPAGSDG